MNLEIISKFISSITLLLNFAFIVFKNRDIFSKKEKDIFFCKSSLLNNCSKEFKKKFIKPEFEDFTFYKLTGINTNEKYSYIEFKKKLGYDFTWQKIKAAKPYIFFDENGVLKVIINRIENSIYFTIKYIFIPTCVFGIIFLYYMITFKEQELSLNLLYFIGLVSTLFLIVFFLNYLNPIKIAFNIKKRIAIINEG